VAVEAPVPPPTVADKYRVFAARDPAADRNGGMPPHRIVLPVDPAHHAGPVGQIEGVRYRQQDERRLSPAQASDDLVLVPGARLPLSAEQLLDGGRPVVVDIIGQFVQV
jgi:hypothetical protein